MGFCWKGMLWCAWKHVLKWWYASDILGGDLLKKGLQKFTISFQRSTKRQNFLTGLPSCTSFPGHHKHQLRHSGLLLGPVMPATLTSNLRFWRAKNYNFWPNYTNLAHFGPFYSILDGHSFKNDGQLQNSSLGTDVISNDS